MKLIKRIEQQMEREGIRFSRFRKNGSGHHVYIIQSADGPRKMFVSGTPSDRRTYQNVIATARRLSR